MNNDVLPQGPTIFYKFDAYLVFRAWVRSFKLRVSLITKNELCRCQLVLRTSKSAGARGDVQNFGGCQAPAAPVLTQALLILGIHTQIE